MRPPADVSLAVPAIVAGVPEIAVVARGTGGQGEVDPAVVHVCRTAAFAHSGEWPRRIAAQHGTSQYLGSERSLGRVPAFRCAVGAAAASRR